MAATALLGSWIFWAVLASLFAALTGLLAKLGVDGIDSNLATLLRTVVVLVALGSMLLLTGQLQASKLGELPRNSLLALGLSGLATGASWLCYFKALQFGPIARVASIDKLSVVLVAIFGVFLLGEQLGWRAWLGVALIGVGGVLVALP
jgi:transporter family protein